MHSKLTAADRAHLGRVKELPCSVCDRSGPSDAHHVVQGQQYTTVALCRDCHQGPVMGWHGQKRAWLVRKMDEWAALNVTIQRLVERGAVWSGRRSGDDAGRAGVRGEGR